MAPVRARGRTPFGSARLRADAARARRSVVARVDPDKSGVYLSESEIRAANLSGAGRSGESNFPANAVHYRGADPTMTLAGFRREVRFEAEIRDV